MKRRQEPCPCIGCLNDRLTGKLMCRRCWRQVPAVLRQPVLDAWKAVRKSRGAVRHAAIRTWRTASSAAIASVNQLNVVEVPHA